MPLAIEIREDDLTGQAIAALLREHLEGMAQASPPESIHALDLPSLRAPEVTFWSAWRGPELVGCGALKELNAQHGEIKSMRTVPAYLRQGVGGHVLTHIIKEAKRRAYVRLSLETGSMEAFASARALYAKFDFEYCPPFGDYVEDPNSVFMTKLL